MSDQITPQTSPQTGPQISPQSSPQTFAIGDRVYLAKRPPYFKTAEPMPMLRPPDLIALGSEGRIEALSPGGTYVVRFSQGSFLVNPEDLTLSPPLSS